MWLRMIAVLGLLCFNSFTWAGETNAIEILGTGVFHGDEVHAQSGEAWYGLYKTEDGYTLKQSVVSIEAAKDPIVDWGTDNKTGKAVAVKSDAPPIVLVRGIELKEGPIHAFYTPNTRLYHGLAFLYPGQRVDFSNRAFSRHEKSWSLIATGNAWTQQENHYLPMITQYQLQLIMYDYTQKPSQIHVQKVVSLPKVFPTVSSTPSILWIGDMDRDGLPDMLLDLSDHYNVSLWALFLSTQSKPGQPLTPVATFRTTGC